MAVLLVTMLAFSSIAAAEPTDGIYVHAGVVVVGLLQGEDRPSVSITRDQYNAFGGTRHTSNNDTRSLGEGITFVADNRNFNEWYIRVTADIAGTIEVAYQISNRHYARTIEINGPGRYIIGDSRGPNGLNEIRLGGFISTYIPTPPDDGDNNNESLSTGDINEAGVSVPITRDQYRDFGGIRHTSNNDTRPLEEGMIFVADNRNLNSWYIYVTGDMVGTIQVAYQIGSRHYLRTIEINGPGRYIIGDSRGPEGLNEIRLGAFIPASTDGVPGDNECRCSNGCICDNGCLCYSECLCGNECLCGGDPYCDKCNNEAQRIRRHGIEFEQVFAKHLTDLQAPFINSVQVEVLDFIHGTYRITISVDDVTVDSRAVPFFFWNSVEGTFENEVYWYEDFASFIFQANPGTSGRNVTLIMGVGDDLGQVARRAVILKGNDGCAIDSPNEENNDIAAAMLFAYNIGIAPMMALSTTFSDLNSGHWAYVQISNLVRTGVVSGFPDGTFRPEDNIIVAEFLAMTIRLAGIQLPPNDSPDWREKYIQYVRDRGLLSDGFDPRADITREYAFYLMYEILSSADAQVWNRLKDAERMRTGNMPFTDAGQINSSYENAMLALFQYGIIEGFTDETIRPRAAITRAQVATILFRAVTPFEALVPEGIYPIRPNLMADIENISIGSTNSTANDFGVQAFRFTAPETGRYIFTATNNFAPIVFRVIREGAETRFVPMHYIPESQGNNLQVRHTLNAGQEVVVAVSGAANQPFTITVELIEAVEASIVFKMDDQRTGPVINGQHIAYTGAAARVHNGHTVIPIGVVMRNLPGGQIQVSGQTITLQYNGTTVNLTVGSTNYSITQNGVTQNRQLNIAPFVQAGSTYVQLRPVLEALGFSIYIDQRFNNIEGESYIIASKTPKDAQGQREAILQARRAWNLVDATGITIEQGNISLNQGATAALRATVQPSNAASLIVRWETSNSGIVQLESTLGGNITIRGVGVGTATITARNAYGQSASVTVTVEEGMTVVWPTPLHHTITAYAGRREISNPYHTGVDTPTPMRTRVYATMAGTVLPFRNTEATGREMIIRHENGFYSSYQHLDEFMVNAGDTVYAGQFIAYSGNTGRGSGPHMHFEVRRALHRDTSINPLVQWHRQDPRHLRWNEHGVLVSGTPNPNPLFIRVDGRFVFNEDFCWEDERNYIRRDRNPLFN